jgi:hypothetical protein
MADKNPDCDTSSIFTAVQSAYEILLQSAPPDPVPRQDHPPHSQPQSQWQPAPRSEGRRAAAAADGSPQKPQYHSTFRRKSEPVDETKIDREQASGVAQMSTEQIRRALQAIGVSHS